MNCLQKLGEHSLKASRSFSGARLFLLDLFCVWFFNCQNTCSASKSKKTAAGNRENHSENVCHVQNDLFSLGRRCKYSHQKSSCAIEANLDAYLLWRIHISENVSSHFYAVQRKIKESYTLGFSPCLVKLRLAFSQIAQVYCSDHCGGVKAF